MSHAIGFPKPWAKKFVRLAFSGNLPTRADSAFWNAANGQIPIFSKNHIRWKKLTISIAGLIGRFYSRK